MDSKERLQRLNGRSIIKESKSTSREETVLDIINKFDYLKKAFKYIISNNNKSLTLPYHNLNHLLTVLKFCYQGSVALKIKDNLRLQSLLVAAIFHDLGHSGGKKTDDLNIKESKRLVRKFSEDCKIDLDLDTIYEIIDATEYPYVIESKELNELQMIIRDSDLMQVYEYNWVHQNIAGLSSEIGLDFEKFIKPQRKFLENCEFSTSWAKNMKKEKWGFVMSQFSNLEEILSIEL